jgi:hypothetical protein
MLKVADFQPRIALVTRTVKSSFVDLIHFLLLFSVVAVGFCIAEVLLFGHQYEAFSTLDRSMFNLLVSLIAWNPGDSWGQVRCGAVAVGGGHVSSISGLFRSEDQTHSCV